MTCACGPVGSSGSSAAASRRISRSARAATGDPLGLFDGEHPARRLQQVGPRASHPEHAREKTSHLCSTTPPAYARSGPQGAQPGSTRRPARMRPNPAAHPPPTLAGGAPAPALRQGSPCVSPARSILGAAVRFQRPRGPFGRPPPRRGDAPRGSATFSERTEVTGPWARPADGISSSSVGRGNLSVAAVDQRRLRDDHRIQGAWQRALAATRTIAVWGRSGSMLASYPPLNGSWADPRIGRRRRGATARPRADPPGAEARCPRCRQDVARGSPRPPERGDRRASSRAREASRVRFRRRSGRSRGNGSDRAEPAGTNPSTSMRGSGGLAAPGHTRGEGNRPDPPLDGGRSPAAHSIAGMMSPSGQRARSPPVARQGAGHSG